MGIKWYFKNGNRPFALTSGDIREEIRQAAEAHPGTTAEQLASVLEAGMAKDLLEYCVQRDQGTVLVDELLSQSIDE